MIKKIQIMAAAFLVSSAAIKAQDNTAILPCNTFDAMDQAFSQFPGSRERFEQAQKELHEATALYQKSLQTSKVAATQYTIPVVFHVLHQGGAENISDAALITALGHVNDDYAKLGSDTASISSLFKSLYGPVDIKFMLAHKDPYGNCTSGIIHHYDANTDWNQGAYPYPYTGTAIGQWNPTKYLNIYIVRSICPSTSTCSTSGGTIVGYTYIPGTFPSGYKADAITYNYQFLGSYLQCRSLSHEIGHWLGLSHTFGNTNNPGINCGDDGISDTPPTKGYFSTCPSSSGGNTCDPSGNANVENIMDYASCPKMFTQGQIAVMRNAAVSTTAGRNNVTSAANLLATDVNGTTTCAPIADLQAPTYTVCSGGSLTFTDISYNAAVTARSWAGTGGATFGSPTGSVTSVTFPTIGTQTVTLQAGNSTGTTTATKIVQVMNGVPNVTGNYSESFEGPGLPTNFSIYNLNASSVTWAQITGPAATGSNSYWINGSLDPKGNIDILETPSYDFGSNPGATFTFKYAYARYNTANVDVLKCQVSSNCGGTWTDISFGSNSTLCTGSGGTTTTPYTPASSAEFKLYTLTSHPAFTPFKSQNNVRIRFTFIEDPTVGNGNNVYLDDINFSLPLGVNELTQSIGFNVYPNPTTGAANIDFTLSNASTVKYSVTDVTGRVVEEERATEMTTGSHTMTINQSQKLKSGIYFVNFELNGQKMSRKIVVE